MSRNARCVGEWAEHPAVLTWSKTGGAFEQPAKEGKIFVAHFGGDLFEGCRGRFQKVLCLFDPQVLNVGNQCSALARRCRLPKSTCLNGTTKDSFPMPALFVASPEAQQILVTDEVFRHLVVQRSRAYARESQIRETGNAAMFPERKSPQVAQYSIRKTYGRLLDMFENAFARQNRLFTLPMYYPLAWYKGSDARSHVGRDKLVERETA
jgi:hypothetical protein